MMQPLHPQDLQDAARDFARESVRLMRTGPLKDQVAYVTRTAGPKAAREFQSTLERERYNLVVDCFLTGAELVIRMLNGDFGGPEWTEQSNHPDYLVELLKKYGWLAPDPCARRFPVEES